MIIRMMLVLGFTSALALPALAVPFCTDDRPGVHFGFSVSAGGKLSESDLNDFDLMKLQQMGIKATAVERWNGCIRAFVRKPGGGEEMQFYDPNTFQRVY